MSKSTDPKLITIEPDSSAREIFEAVRAAHHEEILPEDIELMWFLTPKTRKGKRVLGTCEIAAEKIYRLSGAAVIISFDRAWWQAETVTDNARRYLADHELCHAAPLLDENGDHVIDDTGWRRYVSIPHDLEDFAGPVKRWGVQPDLESFLEAAQLALPGFGGKSQLDPTTIAAFEQMKAEAAEERPKLRAVS